MRFIRIKTTLTMEQIDDKLSYYLEFNKHCSLNPFEDYDNSSRIGLHLYKNEKGYYGYYESGERGRHQYLQSTKNWFKLRVREKGDFREISGYTYFWPLYNLLYLAALPTTMLTEDVSASILTIVLLALMHFMCSYHDQKYIVEDLRSLLENENYIS